MLRGAAAADAEVRAARLAPAAGSLEDAQGARAGKLALAGENPAGDALAGQAALDEHHLAFGTARHAAPFGIERVDAEDQVFQSERNSFQWGSARFSSTLRSRPHSSS